MEDVYLKKYLLNFPEKAVSSEEKFNKMKELYNKLKDEHVSLLRQVISLKKLNLPRKLKGSMQNRLA